MNSNPPGNPLETFLHWVDLKPNALFLRQPLPGKKIDWTYQQASEEAKRIASALFAMNLPSRSNIAILSKNCAEWILADLAIWMAGHVSVPIYPTLSATSIKQILEHSESKVVFIGKLDNFAGQASGIPKDIKCISFTRYGEKKGDQWSDLVTRHEPVSEIQQRQSDEIATIKYTSGTTGQPKGVMITFAAFTFVTPSALQDFQLRGSQRFFSYLPLSPIAERMLVELGAIYAGGEIHFSESLEKFPENLAETQPTIFLAVPRIWAKFREKIEQKMPNLDRLLKIPVVNMIIKKVIRKKLGLAKAQWIFTGAAPISMSLLAWFDKLGIEIHEVYGMTENLAYSHINLYERRFGTVGKRWKNVQHRISEEGEIQTKSPGVMLGYYRDPELTKQMFTEDGFLKTGDKGFEDDRGFVTITGRIKDQFKTDKAKFVDPGPIELRLLNNADIEQVCVVGMGSPQPIGLIVLSAVGKEKDKASVAESLKRSIEAINPDLETYERLKGAVILKEEWTIENGLITPTLKVKRNEIEKIHLPKYPMWYEKNEVVIWE